MVPAIEYDHPGFDEAAFSRIIADAGFRREEFSVSEKENFRMGRVDPRRLLPEITIKRGEFIKTYKDTTGLEQLYGQPTMLERFKYNLLSGWFGQPLTK
jgi:hypothetical protein|tara:strand:- start:1648 stop:1944 length:297 start_codon:yes stop_codon:yes gene_type:complete